MAAPRGRGWASGCFSDPAFVVCLVGFLDLFGVSMVIPLIQTRAKEMGASPSLAGFIGSIYGFLQLFSSPIIGKWSDLVGHRLVLMLCLLLSASGYILVGMSSTLLLLSLARIPAGLFKHSQTISKAYLADIVPLEKRSAIYGRFNAVSSVGFIVGPTVGGHIAEAWPLGFFVVGCLAGFLFIMSCTIIWLCIPVVNSRKGDNSTSRSASRHISVARVLNIFKSFSGLDWTNLWDLFLVKLLLGFAGLMLRGAYTRMLIDRFETTTKTNGYIMSYSGIVSTLCSFGVGRIAAFYNNDARLLLHASLLTLVGLIGLIISPSLWIFILFQTPLSLSSAVNRVVAVTLTVDRGGQSEAGGLMGLSQSLIAISRTLSPILAGLLLELNSVGPVYGCCLAVMLAILVMVIVPDWEQTKSGEQKKEK